MELTLQLVKEDGNKVSHFAPSTTEQGKMEKGEDNPVCPINNIAHSIWARERLIINDQVVNQNNYAAYESHFKFLFSYKQSTKECWLKGLTGWRTDQPGFFDLEANDALEDSCLNLCTNSKQFKVVCHPTFDLAYSDRTIPNGSAIKMIFSRNSDQFTIMNFKEGKSYKLLIKDATFHLKRVVLNPTAQMHLERSLAIQPTIHHVKSLVIKPVNIVEGTRNLTIDSVFSSNYIPERLFTAMVKQEAYVGDFKLNPFNFQHFQVAEISISALGRSQHQYFDWDAEKNNQSVIPYKNFCDFLGNHSLCDSNFGITKEAHENGNFICVFDLSPNSAFKSGVASFDRQGAISLNVRFPSDVGIAHTAVLLVCGVFDNIYNQDINRTFTSPYIF